MAVNLLDCFGDNTIVKENYTNNHYGFRDEFTGKSNGVIVNQKLESALLKRLHDYNPSSSGQLSK